MSTSLIYPPHVAQKMWDDFRLAKMFGTPMGNICDHVERHTKSTGAPVPWDIKSYFMKSNGSCYWLETIKPPRWFVLGELYGIL